MTRPDTLPQADDGQTRRGGRPSTLAAGEIEGKIVDIARSLFFEHGYGATSVEAIAQHASISKRTFYHRFENKAAVFRAVVNRLIQAVTPADVESYFEGRSLPEVLRHLATALLQASLSPESLALHRLVLAEAVRFPELAMVMDQQGARQNAIERIGALLKRHLENHSPPVDPAIAAELFLQMVIATPQRRALGLGTPMSPQELAAWAESAVTMFLHGIER